MRILVTAGPTREYIDDVRFISNPSSGRMGYAVAAEAARRGHEVRLLSGPVCLEPPGGVEVERFEGVEELYRLASAALADSDCLVMAAAVGDCRPKERFHGKRRKGGPFKLIMMPTRDVLLALASEKGERIFVGFAVESENTFERAEEKLRRKSLDLLVLNTPESFGADSARFSLLSAGGRCESLGLISKAKLAGLICERVERLFGHRAQGQPSI